MQATRESERDVARLSFGVAVGQAVAVLGAPVLSRIYSPQDFGVFAVYASIVGVLGAMACLSYHQAIPIPRRGSDVKSLFCLSLICIFSVVAAIALVLGLTGTHLLEVLGAPQLVPYLWLLPVGVLFLAAFELVQQVLIRQKRYKTMAVSAVAQSTSQTGAQILLGLAGFMPGGLLVGQIINQAVGLVILAIASLQNRSVRLAPVSFSRVLSVAWSYRRYPVYSSQSVLWNVLGRSAPPLILTYYFGGAVAGLFALAERVIMFPISLLSKSVSQVFVGSAGKYYRTGRLGAEVEYMLARLTAIGLVPTIVIAAAGPEVFSVVFGEAWTQAGAFVRWMSPWLFFTFVAFSIMPVILVLQKQKEGTVFQASMSICRIMSLIVGGTYGNAYVAVGLFGVVSAVLWAVFLWWLLKISKVSTRRILEIAFKAILSAIPFSVPLISAIMLRASNLVIFVLSLLTALIAVTLAFMRYGGARGASLQGQPYT